MNDVRKELLALLDLEPLELNLFRGIGTVSYTHLTLPTTPYV